MIVTIDGPAGAGKSTVARRLAERLQFDYLDTGAMYRAVALAAMRASLKPIDVAGASGQERLGRLLEGIEIEVTNGRTTLNGEDVSQQIRTPETTALVRIVADQRIVRDHLTRWQRALAEKGDLVTEGRDQGTIVFPDAECKFFITANDTIRAQRRQLEFAGQGRKLTLETVLAEQRDRDRRDAQRLIAPLKPAADARIIDTSELEIEDAVDVIEKYVRAALCRHR